MNGQRQGGPGRRDIHSSGMGALSTMGTHGDNGVWETLVEGFYSWQSLSRCPHPAPLCVMTRSPFQPHPSHTSPGHFPSLAASAGLRRVTCQPDNFSLLGQRSPAGRNGGQRPGRRESQHLFRKSFPQTNQLRPHVQGLVGGLASI